MGDKGGKKDKEKDKQQHLKKQKQEEQRRLWSGRRVAASTKSPSRVRERNVAFTSEASAASHVAPSSPHNRRACGVVSLRPGISTYSTRMRPSSSAIGTFSVGDPEENVPR
jgi:hypothetical protein